MPMAQANPIQRLKIGLIGLLVALLLPLGGLPTLAQSIDTEPVFLDGLFLFDVPGSGDLTAPERAAAIGTNLAPLLDSREPIEVRIETRVPEATGSAPPVSNPIIFADDRYIMTVTQADATVGGGGTPQTQAEVWVNTLNRVLSQAQAERQEGFLIRALARLLAALAIALALHYLTGWFWHRWLQPLAARFSFGTTEVEESRTGLGLLLRLLLVVVQGVVWFGALTYIANLFPVTRRFSYLVSRSLSDGLFARNLILGNRAYSLLDMLMLLATLLALVVAANTVTNILRSRFLSMAGISLAAQEAISVLTKYTLVLLGTVVILQLWGIDLSSIALIASGLGIGIGFGLQNLVKDFVSGLVIVFERPIQMGDFVDFDDVKGTVTRIGSRSTEIRTLDQVSIIVPNSRFLDNEIINWSHGNPVSRIRLPVGVAYRSDPMQVKLALLEACRQNQEILATPSPQVFFLGFGDNSLKFELLVWIAQPNRQLVIKSDLYFEIEASLRHHQIEIPFPQRDLHIRSGSLGSLPVEISTEAQQWLRQLSDRRE
jgi:potassium-dependent mechanosensitive channel